MYNTIIIGIDPGIGITGIGIIEFFLKTNKYKGIYSTFIKTNPIYSIGERLKYIYKNIELILYKYNPTIAIVEQIFSIPSHGIKPLILAQARGAIVVCLANQDIDIYNISSKSIKKIISGSGNSNKLEIKNIICKLLNLDKTITFDESDALACALSFIFYSYKLKFI